MAYVITDACTKDLLCVGECATNAIAPADSDAAAGVPQVYINPDECIDCGSCVSVCPSDAIFPADEVPADKAASIEANKAYFA